MVFGSKKFCKVVIVELLINWIFVWDIIIGFIINCFKFKVFNILVIIKIIFWLSNIFVLVVWIFIFWIIVLIWVLIIFGNKVLSLFIFKVFWVVI